MGLPGNGTIPAAYNGKRIALAKHAGMAVMELIKNNGPLPRDIMTLDAFKNAITVDMAIGGSSNTALHLPAIAHDAGLDLPLSLFDEISKKTPYLTKMSPGGSHHIVDPNEAGGAYQQAIGVLYAVAYTLKMSCKTDYKMEGFFEYVVPPLEGFWWQDGKDGIDYADKSAFHWISVIRLPDFVTRKDFVWAVETAAKKKKLDCSAAEFLTIEEGLCVQMMHLGPFDQEPASVALMDAYLAEHGYENDLSETRLHHEIYLSDARKAAPEEWRTVIRHPIKKR